MQYSYMSSILSTIEKEFGIKSKETAYLNSGNEIAQILFIFFLPLMMKVKKRPLWCGIGMMTTALGLYMMSLPHLLVSRTTTTPTSSLSDTEDCEAETAVPGLCNSTVHLNSLEGSCDEDGNRWVVLTCLLNDKVAFVVFTLFISMLSELHCERWIDPGGI